MSFRIGVDIGGTFTDFAAFDEASGAVRTVKVLSTPDRPGTEVLDGLRELSARFGIAPVDIGYFTHGTTVGINAVIQRRGLRLALLVTEGFADVLELARLKMPDPYDLLSRRPPPLIPRERVFAVRERLLADGSVATPLDADSVRMAVAAARLAGAEGIVIALLHAYRDPVHEQAARAIAAEMAPDLPLFCSTEIWPTIREYERTVTAAVHAYVQPRVAAYLESLREALHGAGVGVELMVTKSNGGVMTAALGRSQCVQMLLSGTASGVIGAGYVARQCGQARVMSLDIGGTSADVALIADGRPGFATGQLVGDVQVFIPTVSVTSIGAGGGSIAEIDAQGMLAVGPDSAGSRPGPVCYGHGGTRVTITDAFAALGFIGHGVLGYGAVTVDSAKAVAAVQALAARMGQDMPAMAEAIRKIAVSGMFREVSKLFSRRGEDPRDYAMLAFGGAGPMLACWLARDMGLSTVIVPRHPGVLSALGGLVGDVRNDFIRTVYVDLDDAGLGVLRAALDELSARAWSWLREEQRFDGTATLLVSADMHYQGQSFEIEVPLDAAALSAAALAQAFNDEHQRLYGYADPAAAVQLVNLRVVVVGETVKPSLPALPPDGAPAVPFAQAQVYCDGRMRLLPLYHRADFAAGQEFAGPAIVLQDDSTLCMPADFTGRADAYGNLVLTRAA